MLMILVCTKAEYLSPQQLPPGSSPVCGLHLVHAEYERAPHVQGPRLWPHTTPGGGGAFRLYFVTGALPWPCAQDHHAAGLLL